MMPRRSSVLIVTLFSLIVSLAASVSALELRGFPSSPEFFTLTMPGRAAPALSPAGQGRWYFDSATNTFQASQNAGAYETLVGAGGSAPANATYITQTTHAGLSAEQALGALTTGLSLHATTTGVVSTYGGTSCTNQFPRSLDASGAATCASVSLTADVSGILPGISGGTGNGFTAFSGPTTSLKTFAVPDVSTTILTDNADVTLAQGGTGATLTASNGGIFYSTASAGAILGGTATAGQMLRSGATAAPTWSTATFPAVATGAGTLIRADGTNWLATTLTMPDTAAVSTLLYASSANILAALATANNGVLVTGAGGIPAISSTLPAGLTATTNFTTPLLIGGTDAASTLTYKTTTGVGTTWADHIFLVGNNGSVEAGRILNSGTTRLGPSGTGVGQLEVRRVNDGEVILRLGDDGLSTTNFDFVRNSSTGALSLQGNQVGNNNIVLAPTSGNVGIGTTSFGTGAAGVLSQGIGTAPSTSPTDVVQEWVEDCAGAGTACRKIRDEGGNVFTIGNNQILTTATGDQGWLSRTLLRAAADGAFAVHNNAGTARFQATSGAAGTGTQVRTAQATVPTCTTNCGTSPSVSGTDTAMVITLGTGVPASPVTVTFNGTWATAPACQASNRTTAANYITRTDSTTTTAVMYFAAGPSASDLVALTCLGVS